MGMRERPRCVEFKNLMKNSRAFFGSTFEGILEGANALRLNLQNVTNAVKSERTGPSDAIDEENRLLFFLVVSLEILPALAPVSPPNRVTWILRRDINYLYAKKYT